jgi:ribonuclease VapC
MIVDTSAIVAILKREPEGFALSKALDAASSISISAATYLETCIVVDGMKNPVLSLQIDEIIEEFDILIEPVTAGQVRIARQAYRDYGKGSGHSASLNFSDCFAYALARDKREPLLYKGDDFVHTDIRTACGPGAG